MKVIHRKPYIAPHVKMVVLHHHLHLLALSSELSVTNEYGKGESETDTDGNVITNNGINWFRDDLGW